MGPMLLSFMPPIGAISVEMMPSLMPTMPYSSASATRQMRPPSARWAFSHTGVGSCDGYAKIQIVPPFTR
jgi:hypothetical protein